MKGGSKQHYGRVMADPAHDLCDRFLLDPTSLLMGYLVVG